MTGPRPGPGAPRPGDPADSAIGAPGSGDTASSDSRGLADGPEATEPIAPRVDPTLAQPVTPDRGRPGLARQLTSFVLVGVVSAIVDFGLLVVLMAAGLGHTPAKAVSWVAGTITAYLLNRRFTFRAAASRARFTAVMVLYLLTFGVQVGLFAVLYPWLLDLSNQRVAQFVGFVIAQGVATVTNFVVQRTLIFRT